MKTLHAMAAVAAALLVASRVTSGLAIMNGSPDFEGHPSVGALVFDIDGSGPTDLIYLGRSGAQLYFNRSGNSLSDALVVPVPVATHNLAAVQVADLLGTGTACLVWNSHLPADASHPVRYVELMADGSSSYAGSANERAINVEVSAEKVTHAVIPPGGTLSFLDAVGKISVDAGFVEGKIIADGWYASDIGGGVCQVSTTVYRAALLAGLPFSEWYPHAFRVSFYELDGWPAGMDAAIYQPNNEGEWELDLVINNPTDSWMLLQMTTRDQVVTASLYGPKTGYQVEISEPELSNVTQPPPPLERTSDEVPTGERRQTKQAQTGVTATLVRRVMKDGELVSEDTFVSVYAPVADAFVVGTGA